MGGGRGGLRDVAIGGAVVVVVVIFVAGRPVVSHFGVIVSWTAADLDVEGFFLGVGVADASLEEECLRLSRCECIPPGMKCR